MNKRAEIKEKTRKLILKKSYQIFSERGVLDTSTAYIARMCKIAHGTLFSHFKTKDELVFTVFSIEIKKNALYLKSIPESDDISLLLSSYIDHLIENEDFYSVISRELPFYSEDLKREIVSMEIAVRNIFYNIIEKGVREKVFNCNNITSSLNFLFGTIDYYLKLKTSFVSKGSVLTLHKDEIIETFLKILS